MMALPANLATQTVTLTEPQMSSDHGTQVADWSLEPSTTTVVPGCSVQPTQGAEADDHRTADQSLVSVFLPPDTVVTNLTHITVEGYPADLQVVGEPMRFVFGMRLDHIEVRAQRWEG